jgi:hypothetical protein
MNMDASEMSKTVTIAFGVFAHQTFDDVPLFQNRALQHIGGVDAEQNGILSLDIRFKLEFSFKLRPFLPCYLIDSRLDVTY